jgi:hypothetical protein
MCAAAVPAPRRTIDLDDRGRGAVLRRAPGTVRLGSTSSYFWRRMIEAEKRKRE